LLVCLANNPANSKTPLMDVDLFAKFVKFAKNIYIYIYGNFHTKHTPYHFFNFFFQQTKQTKQTIAVFSSYYQYLMMCLRGQVLSKQAIFGKQTTL